MPTERSDSGDSPPAIVRAREFRPIPHHHALWSAKVRRAALVAALVIPAVAILYLLATVRPVVIEVNPSDATVAVSGGPSLTLGGRLFLRRGTYRLAANAPGYAPVDTHFEVVSGSGIQRVDIKLVPEASRSRPLAPTAPAMFGNATLPPSATPSAAQPASDATTPETIAEARDTPRTSPPESAAGATDPEAATETPEVAAAPAPRRTEPTPEPSTPSQAEAAAPSSPELILLPATKFTMGASRREYGYRTNETQHDVVLSRPYLLAARETTNREFREFKPAHAAVTTTGEPLDQDEQPVANVSWQDAALYCNWLSAREQLPPFYHVEAGKVVGFDSAATGYRLPTDAEWEWAARGHADGTMVIYAWGDEFAVPKRFGNYADRSARPLLARVLPDYDDGFRVAAPPGSFPPNAWGLHDMSGNVAEWVHDVYDIELQDQDDGATENPLGKPTGRFHVIRGSSWAHSGVSELRLAFRDYSDRSREDVGFRVARYAQ